MSQHGFSSPTLSQMLSANRFALWLLLDVLGLCLRHAAPTSTSLPRLCMLFLCFCRRRIPNKKIDFVFQYSITFCSDPLSPSYQRSQQWNWSATVRCFDQKKERNTTCRCWPHSYDLHDLQEIGHLLANLITEIHCWIVPLWFATVLLLTTCTIQLPTV